MEPTTLKYDYSKFINRLEHYSRINPDPNDCVINAMQLLGLLSNIESGLLRLELKCWSENNGGLPQHIVLSMFKTIYPKYKFDFKSTTDPQEFDYYLTKLPDNQISFCGISRIDGSAHVFLVIKSNGHIYIVDPQIYVYPYGKQIYNLQDDFFNNVSKIHVLYVDKNGHSVGYLKPRYSDKRISEELSQMEID